MLMLAQYVFFQSVIKDKDFPLLKENYVMIING
jgi:hypothetical protein